MKIVVIGGTGLIGSKTVAILRQGGHDVVAASPKGGVNTITGEGLKEAMAGAQVVIDLTNSPSFEDRAVRAGILTHDYKRNGTTTQFAPLNVLEGKVIGRCMQRQRHQSLSGSSTSSRRRSQSAKSAIWCSTTYATHKHPQGEGLAAAASALRLSLHPEIVLLA